MSWDNVAIIGLVLVSFGLGVFAARSVARLLLHERGRREDEWAPLGTVFGSDITLRIAMIFVWSGFVLGSISLLPGLAWAFDGDGEAGTAAIRVALVGAVIVAIGALCALPSLRLLILQPSHLTRAGVFRNTSIAFSAVERVEEAKMLPAIRVHSAGDTIRLSRNMANFDDLYNRLVAEIGTDVFITRPRKAHNANTQDARWQNPPPDGHYAVSLTRIRLNLGFLGAALAFFMIWPWFLVEGDHPVRDSFAFMGIGLLVWTALAFLVANETFQKGQPVELELRDSSIAWRTLRGGWTERAADELVSAAVEPHFIYVKGQPGRRYPLRLRFVDDQVLEIDDFRGRHLGSSTHNIGVDVRNHYFDVSKRSPEQRASSEEALAAGRGAETRAAYLEAVAPYRAAIASWPSAENLALYAHVGDILRTHGETPEHRADAIAHYQAHVDLFPTDASAWQALGSCLSGGLRTDSADEAIAAAEQLLMAGRDETSRIRSRRPDADRTAADN